MKKKREGLDRGDASAKVYKKRTDRVRQEDRGRDYMLHNGKTWVRTTVSDESGVGRRWEQFVKTCKVPTLATSKNATKKSVGKAPVKKKGK